MKKCSCLLLGLLFTICINAQDELSLIHQTITANAQEINALHPVFLDLDDNNQTEVDEIVKLLIADTEASLVAKRMNTIAKATNIEQPKLLSWVVREATIITLGLEDNIEARTWTMKMLLETESAGNLKIAHQVKAYFDAGDAIVKNIE